MEVVDVAKKKRVSVLAERIAAGKADPISAEERAIVAGFRADYERKYGRPANIRVPSKKVTKTA